MDVPKSLFRSKTVRPGRRALPVGPMVGLDVPARRFRSEVRPTFLKFKTSAAPLLLFASTAAGKTDSASLSRLHDILLPDPVSWWPPGPAWAVLAYLLAAVLLVLGIRARMKWNANRYRRLALRELAQIERSERSGQSGPAIEAIPALLKRTAMVAFGRPTVASLSGEAWSRFLERSSRSFAETGESIACFMSPAFQPDAAKRLTADDRKAVIHAARSWIRNHRVDRADTIGAIET